MSLEAGTVQVPVNTPSAAALEAGTAALETSIATLEASTAALEADPPVTSAREPREVPAIWLELRRLPPNSPILKNTGPGPGLDDPFL